MRLRLGSTGGRGECCADAVGVFATASPTLGMQPRRSEAPINFITLFDTFDGHDPPVVAELAEFLWRNKSSSEGVSWRNVLNNHTTNPPKSRGTQLVPSLKSILMTEKVRDDFWQARFTLPNSFRADDNWALAVEANGPSVADAEAYACWLAVTLLLLRTDEPSDYRLMVSHWTCGIEAVWHRAQEVRRRAPAPAVNAADFPDSRRSLRSPAYEAPLRAGEAARESEVLHVLHEMLRREQRRGSAWVDPSHPPGKDLAWELGRLLPRGTLRDFVSTHKQFFFTAQSTCGRHWYFASASSSATAPTSGKQELMNEESVASDAK